MANIFVDTNILIRLLDSDEAVIQLLDGNMIFISEMTEMEMLCNTNMTSESREMIRVMLDSCVILPFNSEIKYRAIKVRLSTRMKLIDSIIAATAIGLNMPFVTRDNGFEPLSNQIDLILLD